jgi:cell division protein FtsL
MKKAIVISIVVAVIVIAIFVTYAASPIPNQANITKSSENVTQHTVTGKHYEVDVNDGMGFREKP